MFLPQVLRLPLAVLLLGSFSCPALFAAPVPAKPVPSQRSIVTVPFDYDPILMPYIVVQASINGQPPLLDGTLKYDDMVCSINGQPVSKMTTGDALRLLERPDLALQVWRSSDKTWQEVHIAPLAAQTQVLVGPPPGGTQYRYYDKAGWTVVPL